MRLGQLLYLLHTQFSTVLESKTWNLVFIIIQRCVQICVVAAAILTSQYLITWDYMAKSQIRKVVCNVGPSPQAKKKKWDKSPTPWRGNPTRTVALTDAHKFSVRRHIITWQKARSLERCFIIHAT